MLKVFFGNDVVQVRREAFAFVDDQPAGVTVESIDSDRYESGIFADAAGGVSLFGGAMLYVIDTPSINKDMYEDTVAHLEHFAVSPHTFIVIEDNLLAPEKKKFGKHGELNEFKGEKTERFNTFSLTDALARKDKKSLWLLFHEARLSGIAIEEIVGVLWWQLKTLRLATLTDTASEAGMKDFPYNKAKRALNKFKVGELEAISQRLLTLQHESRLGKRDLDIAFERWLLTL